MKLTVATPLKRWLKRVSLGVGGLLVVLLVSGMVYQEISESRDLARFPAPGALVNVAGHLMHIHCLGQGSPTVVLEQGLNGVASAWGEVHRQTALLTRVCAYDRAGLGYSEPIHRPTRAPEVAGLLGRLLESAGIDDDLILVGWSAGGVYVREFQRQNPVRAKAMLLVESSHEQQAKRYPIPPEDHGGDSTLRIASYLAPLGLVRMSGMVKSRFESFGGSDDQRARLIAIYEQSHVIGTMLRESEAFNFDIDGESPPSLGDLPLIVISRATPAGVPSSGSPEEQAYAQRHQEVEQELQRELTSLSTRGRQVVATKSGHAIHLEQPEIVIESIGELVRLVRSAGGGRSSERGDTLRSN